MNGVGVEPPCEQRLQRRKPGSLPEPFQKFLLISGMLLPHLRHNSQQIVQARGLYLFLGFSTVSPDLA